jgi:protein-S-isoprenylcysteine O-methyltransferase Ste14
MMYTNSGYAMGFGLTFGLWALSELLGPVRWGRSKKGQRRDRSSLLLGFLSGTTGVLLAIGFPLILPAANMPPAAFFGGMGLVVLGAGWRWYAIRTLGSYFTATVLIQNDQLVVQHGPYKYCRHPSYAGVIFVVAGFGCLIGNWLSVLCFVGGLLLPLLYRISVEEQEMLSALGETYRDYMSQTKWRLIPFVF